MARSSHSKFCALARRYASALFDLAREDGRVGEILGELQSFKEAQDKVPSLCKSLEDKEVPHRSKQQIIFEIAKMLRLSPLCQNALLLIIEKNRLELFGSIVESYRKMAEEFERMTHVRAQIANPLLVSTIKDRVEKILSDILKKKVVCETMVDSSLIGGAIVRIGDIVVDASISGRLAKMKEELLSS